MAITLRGTAQNGAIDGGAVTVTLPGGTAQDDVVYAAWCCADNDNNDFNLAPTTGGYTELADVFANAGTESNLGVFRKVQGATPDTTFVTPATGGTDAANSVAVMVLDGVDTATPEDATTTTSTDTTSSAVPDPPSITTVTASAWVLAIGGTSSAATVSISAAPSGYSDLVTTSRDDTNDGAVAIARKEVSSPGAENPGAFTKSGGATSPSAAAASVAVRPAGGGETVTMDKWFMPHVMRMPVTRVIAY